MVKCKDELIFKLIQQNFTTGDTGIATAGNSNATFNAQDAGAQGAIAAETSVYYISNIILHIEAYQFKTGDYYNVMKALIEAEKYRHHFKRKCFI